MDVTSNIFFIHTNSQFEDYSRALHVYFIFCFSLIVLSLLPKAFSAVLVIAKKNYPFRAVLHLTNNSPLIGRECPNEGRDAGGRYLFRIGDIIIKCPLCGTPHHIACWRLNQDKCMKRDCEYELTIPVELLSKYGLDKYSDHKPFININTGRFRTFKFLIVGALGGLHGWLCAILITNQVNDSARLILFGSIFGFIIGLSVATFEEVTKHISSYSFLLSAKTSLMGCIAGFFSLTGAQLTYNFFSLSNNSPTQSFNSDKIVLISVACWAIFGGLLGFGLNLLHRTQSIKGLIIGALAGLIAGGAYEYVFALFGVSIGLYGQHIALAASMSVIGGAMGIVKSLNKTIIKRAWIEVASGKFSGKIYEVTKYVIANFGDKTGYIGSDEWGSNVYLPEDKDVLPCHAQIRLLNGRPTLIVMPEVINRSKTLLNGRSVTQSSIRDRDQLLIGSTLLIYRQTEK